MSVCRVLVDVSAMLMQRSTDSLSALVSQGGAFGLLSVLSNLLQLSSSFQSAIRLLLLLFLLTPSLLNLILSTLTPEHCGLIKEVHLLANKRPVMKEEPEWSC